MTSCSVRVHRSVTSARSSHLAAVTKDSAQLLAKQYFNCTILRWLYFHSVNTLRRVDQRQNHAIVHAKTKLIHIVNTTFIRKTHTHMPIYICIYKCMHRLANYRISLYYSDIPLFIAQIAASILFWTITLHNQNITNQFLASTNTLTSQINT